MFEEAAELHESADRYLTETWPARGDTVVRKRSGGEGRPLRPKDYDGFPAWGSG